MVKVFDFSDGDRIFSIIVSLLLFFTSIIVLYPLVYILSASVSDPGLVNSGKVWLLPMGFTLDGYKLVFEYTDIWVGYRNTIIYTITGTIVNVFLTIITAYPLSRKDFGGRVFFMFLFTFTMFFHGGIIPTYLVVKNLGLLNNFWVMILPNAVAMWNIIITRTFFQTSIPIELQESAWIDGASNIRILLSIILPLSPPIIAVIALFYAVGHWNAFFNALIYLSDRSLYPLQLILREILVMEEQMDMMSIDAESMIEQMRLADLIKYSVIVVSTLPIIIIYPLMQKYFVQGIMVGALKG